MRAIAATFAFFAVGCDPPPLCDEDGVWANDAVIDEQADVDAFSTCRVVAGSLLIRQAAPRSALYDAPIPLASLRGLTQLERVDGALVIDNASLQHTEGLDGLEIIGGGVTIANNAALTSITGFGALTAIGCGADGASCGAGELLIENNPLLEEIEGFDALTSLSGNVRVRTNPQLATWKGFSQVPVLNGELWVHGNPALTSLDAFSSATEVRGSVWLASGEGALESVEGLLALESVAGLHALERVGGSLVIAGTRLASLTELSALESANDLVILANRRLRDLRGLERITSVAGHVMIGSSLMGALSENGLTSLAGLESLSFVGGDFLVAERSLRSVLALAALENVSGTLAIGAWFGGSVIFRSLIPCEELTSTGLTSLAGLEGLRTVGGDVPAAVAIRCHANLSDISALDGVTLRGGDVWIDGNPSLSRCDVEAFSAEHAADCVCSDNGACP